jgi:hypothetical protein
LGQRYSIPDAAKALELTEEAVRQRVKRGTLDSIKVDGRLFVLLDIDTSSDTSSDREEPVKEEPNDTSSDTSRLVETLEDEVAHLRRQLDQANERDRENRRIIAGLVQRVPELEAAPEQREPTMTDSEGADGGVLSEPEQRSWWRRFFGIE